MIMYRLYFSVILCDRFTSNFMRTCELCDHVGIRTTVTMTTNEEPTDEYIKKITKVMESTKDEKSLKQYYTCVEFIKVEEI